MDFLTVLKERRSVKQLGRCTLEELSQILYYGVKPYCIGKDDYGMTVYSRQSHLLAADIG